MRTPETDAKICAHIVEEFLYFPTTIKATKFLDEKFIIRGTRRLYGGKIRKGDSVEILFTLGRPNFKEREFIKSCKKAGEPFPIKKTQIKYAHTT